VPRRVVAGKYAIDRLRMVVDARTSATRRQETRGPCQPTHRSDARTLTFHDLRHSYGTLAASIYANLREVQEYMGHASVTTTELYAHFVPRLDAAARGARPASQRC
jgi:integrase